ncbi:MAG TPA: glycoside hydrolase family 125 protein [Bacteroidales bacterium]|nr:glycoside hydrolase family 125 protein [Bacteroidales bacterium]
MATRRRFIRNTVMAGAALSAGIPAFSSVSAGKWNSNRPGPKLRKFQSKAVEETIKEVKSFLGDTELAWLFENCFPNTLDTTVSYGVKDGRPDTFVITGDINAMWLRDSTAQVWPYVSLTPSDSKLRDLIAGVINRQVKCIHIDPYANAFNDGPGQSEWMNDLTDMKPELHERKWEIDSLCYPVRLAHGYWKATGDTSVFDNSWAEAMRLVITTFRQQQRKEDQGPYRFQRVTAWQTDTVAGGGFGNPVNPVGLIVSIFRPSDDATIWPFLIPSNYFAVKSLRQIAEIAEAVLKDKKLGADATSLADEIEAALIKYARAIHPENGEIIPYETDGYYNYSFMDDANVPSLLAMPYLGTIGRNDELYLRTRNFVLSKSNPWYFSGKMGHGVGSPHTGTNRVWPIAITMRALTANNDYDIVSSLKMLKNTHAATGFMHESFMKDDPTQFTRKWFAWANTLFGELVLGTFRTRPELLKEV